jgi:hypothetical protein
MASGIGDGALLIGKYRCVVVSFSPNNRKFLQKSDYLAATHYTRLRTPPKKPGFSENIRCETQIREKTRFLGVTRGLRNRVFPKIFVAIDKFGKNPGFFGRSA